MYLTNVNSIFLDISEPMGLSRMGSNLFDTGGSSSSYSPLFSSPSGAALKTFISLPFLASDWS